MDPQIMIPDGQEVVGPAAKPKQDQATGNGMGMQEHVHQRLFPNSIVPNLLSSPIPAQSHAVTATHSTAAPHWKQDNFVGNSSTSSSDEDSPQDLQLKRKHDIIKKNDLPTYNGLSPLHEIQRLMRIHKATCTGSHLKITPPTTKITVPPLRLLKTALVASEEKKKPAPKPKVTTARPRSSNPRPKKKAVKACSSCVVKKLNCDGVTLKCNQCRQKRWVCKYTTETRAGVTKPRSVNPARASAKTATSKPRAKAPASKSAQVKSKLSETRVKLEDLTPPATPKRDQMGAIDAVLTPGKCEEGTRIVHSTPKLKSQGQGEVIMQPKSAENCSVLSQGLVE